MKYAISILTITTIAVLGLYSPTETPELQNDLELGVGKAPNPSARSVPNMKPKVSKPLTHSQPSPKTAVRKESALEPLDHPSRPDYYDQLPPLEVRVTSFDGIPSQELAQEVATQEKMLDQQGWIERANRDQLAANERRQLADLMQGITARRLVLLRRQLQALEQEAAR